MGRDQLGEFEHQVLLAVLRLGGDSYSVPLVAELERLTDRDVAQAAVFMALRRLEAKGLLTSRMDESAVPETGRVRRYFTLTDEGVARLRETRRTLFRLWRGFEAPLDDA